jgi:hypothetical protein
VSPSVHEVIEARKSYHHPRWYLQVVDGAQWLQTSQAQT